MNTKEEINMLVKRAFDYMQYEKMSPEERDATYGFYQKRYGNKDGVRVNTSRDKAIYHFMSIHEHELEKARAAKARRDALIAQQQQQQAEDERRASEERARKQKADRMAADRKKAEEAAFWKAWEAKNKDILTPAQPKVSLEKTTAKVPRPRGVTGLGKNIDRAFSDFANATGNTVIGSGGVTEWAPQGGIFGRR